MAGAIRAVALLLVLGCLPQGSLAAGSAPEADASTPASARPPLASPQGLGWRLVGIVVAEDPATHLAVIEDVEARTQRVYRAGDRARGVLIKRILRDEVIVDAGEGDRRVPLQQGFAFPGPRVTPDPAPRQPAARQTTDDRTIVGRRRTVHLDRDEAVLALRDPDRVLRDVTLSPVVRFDEPAGLRITDIPPGSVLSRIGLRDGDVIERVDGDEITHPDEIEALLRRIREGGDVVVTVKKRRRTRHIVLKID